MTRVKPPFHKVALNCFADLFYLFLSVGGRSAPALFQLESLSLRPLFSREILEKIFTVIICLHGSPHGVFRAANAGYIYNPAPLLPYGAVKLRLLVFARFVRFIAAHKLQLWRRHSRSVPPSVAPARSTTTTPDELSPQ